MYERAAGNERSGCGYHVRLARMYTGCWYPFWAGPFAPGQLDCLLCATVATWGRPVGWTVNGDAWLAVAAALPAPLARPFISSANGTGQGQKSTWVAHPGRFSSLSEADRGTVARPERRGRRMGCW